MNGLLQEIEILKENYPTKGPVFCSNLLVDRGIRACSRKAKNLNIIFDVSFRYKKDNLIDVVNKSKNYSDCLKNLGINSITTGNYSTLKKYIKLYNINISHFNSSYNLIMNNINSKIELKDILVENSTYSRQNLKRRLYEEGLKTQICEMCGQDENWNGMKISLILDHINGINDDNRIENLRIVCPNCNAGLDTHCAKNKKGIKPKKLCKCGKNIRKESDMCVQCLGKSRKEYKIPYEQLKLDIEELGYAGTGRKYNVSDTTIKNWLENYKELKYEKENETL